MVDQITPRGSVKFLGMGYKQPAPLLLPALTLSTLTERRAYARAWNRRANRAEAVNAAGMAHVMPPGALTALPAYRLDTVEEIEFFDLLRGLPPQSVDLFLCDLPYGTTACSWDEIIPFEPLWAAVRRVIKSRGAIVLTASQPFTSRLVCSNLGMFKYEWVWKKSKASDFINANFRPMKIHESILVFSQATAAPGGKDAMSYRPQGINATPSEKCRNGSLGIRRDRDSQQGLYYSKGSNYPTSLLDFPGDPNSLHPTQKPVALFEYLIRTYTQSGDLVVDPCVGSGTTAIAARNTGRHFICGDNGYDERTGRSWEQVARDRLAEPYTPALPLLDVSQPPAVQTAFAFAAP